VFIAAGTCLSSRFLATLRGGTDIFFQNKESGLQSREIRQMIKLLFNVVVSSSDYADPHGEMISESEVEWPLPEGTEEHHVNVAGVPAEY
jgi:hypothetical protein